MPVKLNSAGGGSVTLDVGSTATNFTQTLPSATTTIVGTDTTQTLTNKTLTSPVLEGTPTGVGVLTSGTAVATTSGTAFDYTGIPSWVKRISVMFTGVSLTGTDNFLIQLGDSGGIETSGYNAQSSNGSQVADSTAGFPIRNNGASQVLSGIMTIANFNSNTWVASGNFNRGVSSAEVSVCAGTKTLSDVLTQIRITRTGTNTFDAGSINILYE
jgi:hypothetical protein